MQGHGCKLQNEGANLLQYGSVQVAVQPRHACAGTLRFPQLSQHPHACPGKFRPGLQRPCHPLLMQQLQQAALCVICTTPRSCWPVTPRSCTPRSCWPVTHTGTCGGCAAQFIMGGVQQVVQLTHARQVRLRCSIAEEVGCLDGFCM